MRERPRAQRSSSTAAAVVTAAAVEAVEAALVAALLTAAAVLTVGTAAARVIDRLASCHVTVLIGHDSGGVPSYAKVSHLCWWPSHVCVTLAVNMEASNRFHACHAVQS